MSGRAHGKSVVCEGCGVYFKYASLYEDHLRHDRSCPDSPRCPRCKCPMSMHWAVGYLDRAVCGNPKCPGGC